METLHNGFMVVKTEIKISSLVQRLRVYKKISMVKTSQVQLNTKEIMGLKKSVNILNK